jgi:uroporphyrin-III C-methyltransferase/precorrin-2 dehydrogenase/sirohydrochlorin ferrochelatase
MDHLPIFLNVDGKRTLIVGNGVSAARKADLVLRAGSDLTIVAPELGEELSQLADSYSFKHQKTEL